MDKFFAWERDHLTWYMDMAHLLLVGLDRDGRVQMLNRRGCEILGYEKAEALGRDWFETCLPAEQVEGVKAVFRRLMDGEIEPVEYWENPVRTRTGEERLIAWHNAHRRDASGRIIGTLSSGDDITDRKRSEEELSRHRDHLETLLAERTEALRRNAADLAAAK